MNRKITIITGATSGIGFETAKALYLRGHYLILGNRNQEKALYVKEKLMQLKPGGNIDLLDIDLSSFSSIKAFVSKIIKNYEHIDILINNAGVFMRNYELSEQGFEMTMAVNYLGTYYLTELLKDKLLETKHAKIIMLSSIGCYWGTLKIKPEMFKSRINGFQEYFNSKLATLIYTKELLDENKENDIIIKAADPGVAYSKIWKWKTRFGKSLDKIYQKLFHSSAQAARIIILLADSETYDKDNHLLYKFNRRRRLPHKVKKEEFRKSLIEHTLKTIESTNLQ